MNYSKSFLITLGHNSSVIFYDGVNKPIGYEEERLSNIKSDSSYPKLAFERVLSLLTKDQIEGSNVFISHWFDTFEIVDYPSKYFNIGHFADLVLKHSLNVIPVNSSFTHHDAHAYSTLAFSENFPTRLKGEKHFIVLDGFGNNQEVLSIYRQDGDSLEPLKRVYGFEHSLGLLYQYATSFTGMKENQDEYKFLGYEASISKVLNPSDIEDLNIEAYNYSMSFMKKCLTINTLKPEATGSAIDFDHLREVKANIYAYLKCVIEDLPISVHQNQESIRTVIGYFVQACLEQSLLRIIKKYDMKNVFLSGGCFLNVKLNKVILDNIPGSICINPLAGDQGAAIGLYRKYTDTKFDFNDLCFGVRNKLELSEVTRQHLLTEGIYIYDNKHDFVRAVSEKVNRGNIVNIIQNNMEYGPRALCNTTTLAMPSSNNTMYINMVNNRNEVMPMAPVMLKSDSGRLLGINHLNRVIGSNKFMIITHDFTGTYDDMYRGVLHTKPLEHGYTCRPQVIDDYNSNIAEILKKVGSYCLINTSFNTHGRPILYTFESAIDDFRKQKQKDSSNRLILVILNKND